MRPPVPSLGLGTSGGASSAGEPGQSTLRSSLSIGCPYKMMVSYTFTIIVQARVHGRAQAAAPGSREVAPPLLGTLVSRFHHTEPSIVSYAQFAGQFVMGRKLRVSRFSRLGEE